jgi:hypothetical protein
MVKSPKEESDNAPLPGKHLGLFWWKLKHQVFSLAANNHTNNFLLTDSPLPKLPLTNVGVSYVLGYIHNFALFLIFCGLSTHNKKKHTNMAHCQHHPSLSSHSASGHVLPPSPLLPPQKNLSPSLP